MKIEELIKLVDDAIANVKIAIVSSKQRIFESPHTSWEFTKRSLELEDELEKLNKIREYLSTFSVDEDVEKKFSKEELKELLEYLRVMREMKIHEF